MLITGVRVASDPEHQTSVLLKHGRIAEIGARAPLGVDSLDLSGYLLLPSAVEPHAHLDKALLMHRVPKPTEDLDGAIAAIRAAYATLDGDEVTARASAALRTAVQHGYTAVRSHVDCNAETNPDVLAALLALRDSMTVVDLQLAALAGFPITGSAGLANRAALRQALERGVDVVGGCPAKDDDPAGAVGELVAAAADADLPIDLHIDETTDRNALSLRDFAQAVTARGLGGRAVASHCVSLGQQNEEACSRLCRSLAGSGVAVVTLPQTNLYLQGRGDRTRTPRAVAPARELLAAGVTVAGGGDNWQDPFNPLGRIDPMETAALLVAASHLSPEEAMTATTAAARTAMGLPPVDIVPGAPADLLAIRARALREAIATATEGRVVFKAGEVVSRTTVAVEQVTL